MIQQSHLWVYIQRNWKQSFEGIPFTAALFLTAKSESESRSVMLTLCHPMDYTGHEIIQAKIIEWVAFPFSRGSAQPSDWTQVSRIAGRFFSSWATREAQEYWSGQIIPSPGCKKRPGRRNHPYGPLFRAFYWAVALRQNSRGRVSKEARRGLRSKGSLRG